MVTSHTYLLIGLILAAPFFILNALVATGAPIVEVLRFAGHTTIHEQYLILGLLFLVFLGGVVSLYPVVKTRRFIALNILAAMVLAGFSIMAGYGLGVDIYHCDILRIPNCD